MAPEVLRNPASRMQESPLVTKAHLEAKGIRSYTSAVDVWAVGILAYELVCGKPPFEVGLGGQSIVTGAINRLCMSTGE